MSLSEENYKLNGFKGKMFLNFHEFLFVVEKNIFKIFQFKPAFLDALKTNVLNDNLIGAEIGVYRGRNALTILSNLSIKKLYLIDPYKSYKVRGRTFAVNDDDYKFATKLLKRFNNKIEWHLMYSDEAIDLIADDLDFIYYDGYHNYNGIKKDIELFKNKLKIGGLFCFDDVSNYDFSRAIVEAIDNYGFEPVDGCINCLKKIS